MNTAHDSWKVLEDSGYIDAWVPATLRAHVYREYIRYWSREHDSRIAHIVYERGVPVGLAAATEIDDGVWLLHHLAKSPGTGAPIHSPVRAVDLIVGLLDKLFALPDVKTFEIYFERDKQLNAKFFLNFTGPGEWELTPIDIYRSVIDGLLDAPTPHEESVIELKLGSEGMNVFNLANVVSLRGIDREADRDELLSVARHAYSVLGKHSFLYLAEPDEAPPPNMEFVSKGYRWRLPRETALNWLQYLKDL